MLWLFEDYIGRAQTVCYILLRLLETAAKAARDTIKTLVANAGLGAVGGW